jgi:V8-like Glu-specific endopeptidase
MGQGPKDICTVTLIGQSCFIGAGHCADLAKTVEFDVPNSKSRSISHSKRQDIYKVNSSSLVYDDNGPGLDWLVGKLENSPGNSRGFYPIKKDSPLIGESLSIAGYGKSDLPELHAKLKIGHGTMTDIKSYERITFIDGQRKDIPVTYLSFNTPASKGDSGSALVNDHQEIMGVFTHGFSTENQGTYIKGNKEFSQAIDRCLESEK